VGLTFAHRARWAAAILALAAADNLLGFRAARRVSGHFSTRRERHTLAPLSRFLTSDAVPRPRNGFQPFQFYVAAAFGALAETPLPHPL